MSNYKSVDVSFNDLCSSFTTDIGNNYKNTNIQIKASDFNNNGDFTINEKPDKLKYFVDGTDISDFSIAKYIDMSGTFTITNSDIPLWCKKIRAVLVGGGGSGGKGTNAKNTYVPAVNRNQYKYQEQSYQRQNEKRKDVGHTNSENNTNYNNTDQKPTEYNNSTTEKFYANNDGRLVNTHNITRHFSMVNQTNTAANNSQQAGIGGAGGGGGGFIYLDNVDVFGKTLKVDASGGNITLSTGTSNYARVKKGTDATGNTNGSGGGTDFNSYSNVRYPGGNGAKSNSNTGSASGKSKLSSISSSIPYGNGGNGGNGGIAPINESKEVPGNDGVPGQSSFCRIYFLTN